jgi:hypothetical protein
LLSIPWLARHVQNYVPANGIAHVAEALLVLTVPWESAFVKYAADCSFPGFEKTQDLCPYHCVKRVNSTWMGHPVHKFIAMVGVPPKYRGATKKNPKGQVVGAPTTLRAAVSPYFDTAEAR